MDNIITSNSKKMTDDKQNKQILDEKKKMTLWFVLGPAGAGKSSLITRVLKNKQVDLTYISADILKRDTNLPYIKVREMMEKIVIQAVKDRVSFVTEGTGQHDDLYNWFSTLKKDPEIDLKITYIDIPLDVALERNRTRTRVLDDSIVKQIYENSLKRRDKWKDFGCHYVNYKDIMVCDGDFSEIY